MSQLALQEALWDSVIVISVNKVGKCSKVTWSLLDLILPLKSFKKCYLNTLSRRLVVQGHHVVSAPTIYAQPESKGNITALDTSRGDLSPAAPTLWILSGGRLVQSPRASGQVAESGPRSPRPGPAPPRPPTQAPEGTAPLPCGPGARAGGTPSTQHPPSWPEPNGLTLPTAERLRLVAAAPEPRTRISIFDPVFWTYCFPKFLFLHLCPPH
ncbi:translation initiation factor IF-2-like [Camelus ferus]|uniref:Translation initiation factor IF-2-like n=1 Tax=Camelus ferus TaxID=419612 RepID=A0A8B8U0A7_CAMFR|nr:translation initiation factor IF-2-like [Camelus ferus]